MKVSVDLNECVATGNCVMAAPEIFALSDDEDHVTVTRDDIPPEFEKAATEAVDVCPVRALRLG
jgi:ferredoxin